MFCYQCQETIKNHGCNLSTGACGKKAETSDLQDLLVYTAKGVAAYSSQAKAFFNVTECDTCSTANLYLINSLLLQLLMQTLMMI